MRKKTRKIIYPKAVSPEDHIGIVAPASPFDLREFNKGKDLLASYGFKLHFRKDLFDRKGFLAGTDKNRAAGFMRTYRLPKIKALIAARGGYGSMRC